MGFFSFLSKDPEVFEKKGDSFLDKEDFGSAKIEYEKAMEKAAREPDRYHELLDRLKDKQALAMEGLAGRHVQKAEELIEAGLMDDAAPLLELALELTRSENLAGRIRDDLSQAALPDIKQTVVSDADQNPDVEPFPDDEFFAYCGTYSEEIESAYHTYGETFKQAVLLANQGDFENALPLFEHAIEENGGEPGFMSLEMASALIHLNETGQARDLLENLVKVRPDCLEAVRQLYVLLCSEKNFEDAHALLDRSQESLPSSVELLRLKGDLLAMEGNLDQAETWLKDIMERSDFEESVARSLIQVLEAREKIEEARGLAVRLINTCASCGQRPALQDRVKAAELSFQLGEYTSAMVDIYLEASQADPGMTGTCYQRIARILRENGSESEALRYEALAERMMAS